MNTSYPEELHNPAENLNRFSAYLGNTFHVSPTMLCDNIFCSVSMALSHEPDCREAVALLYQEDSQTYYAAAKNSQCSRHVILSQGNLENDLYAFKALGILLVSENKTEIRKKIIHILRFHYPHIYKTVRKRNFKYLLSVYTDLNYFLTSLETRYERAIYFYLSFYCSPDWVDQGMVNKIAQNIYEFEYYSPIHADLNTEIAAEQKSITRIGEDIRKVYGEISNYLQVLNHPQPFIRNMGYVMENLFYINKLNMDDIYYDYHTLPMNQIYLACLKQTGLKSITDKSLVTILACIFIQPLLDEYKKAKDIIREYQQENRDHQLLMFQQRIKELESENQDLLTENKKLTGEKADSAKMLNQTINQIKLDYESEIAELNHRIKDLVQQLSDEYSYRQELNQLREFIFSLNIPPVQEEHNSFSLNDAIAGKQIAVIGGPRTWRRKLREHFPMIQFLNGTSSNLDLSYIKNTDCVLFYTNYLSHAIYNKAMNYIRINQIKFGYLKATNIQLIETEILDVLKQVDLL